VPVRRDAPACHAHPDARSRAGRGTNGDRPIDRGRILRAGCPDRSPARRAQAVGLGVNAGHDLSQDNLRDFLAHVPEVLEVSIGHALIGEALYDGLDATVRGYLALL